MGQDGGTEVKMSIEGGSNDSSPVSDQQHGNPSNAASASTYKHLQGAQQMCEKMCGGGGRERKIHLINWDMLCRPKERGDVGLKKVVAMNKALLSKFAWGASQRR